jgi:hypothetical protein
MPTKQQLLKLLRDSNEALRSAHDVAARGGHQTHWPMFKLMIEKILIEQHEVLRPKPGSRRKCRAFGEPGAISGTGGDDRAA